jgi:hypothetical protein
VDSHTDLAGAAPFSRRKGITGYTPIIGVRPDTELSESGLHPDCWFLAPHAKY